MKKKKTDKREMPFLDHLEELRWRIIKCLTALIVFTCAAFPATTGLLKILTYPNAHLPHPAKLVFLKPTAMIMIRMEIAIAAGFVASLPVLFFQIWRFVAPGLLKKEKKAVLPVLLLTVLCFAVGALFAYLVIIPVMLPFLFSMGTQFIEAFINISDYMSFVLRLILVCGLIFELPVVAFFLARIGLLTPRFLIRVWRYSVVFIFIFSAVVTPTPDPVNMTIMAAPLLLLYGLSIGVAAIAQKKRRKASAPERPAPVKKPKRPATRRVRHAP
jgi:sec-independent protein translocase protein TatC